MRAATPLARKKPPIPPITDMSLILLISGSAPAKFMLPLCSVELNPSQAVKIYLPLVVELDALGPSDRGRVQVIVQRYRVIKHDEVAEVALAPVAPGWCSDDCRGGILCVHAVVDYVVEVEDQALTRSSGSDLATVKSSQAEDKGRANFALFAASIGFEK